MGLEASNKLHLRMVLVVRLVLVLVVGCHGVLKSGSVMEMI
jgi:hypothetical protein